MNLMDLALKNGDWEWCARISKISTMSQIELIDEEIKYEILPKIYEMDNDALEYCFPKMIYAINNSEKYSEEFLKDTFKEMKFRYRSLLKETVINKIKESKKKQD